MPIVVACPSCQTRLKVPDQAAGKMVKCPKCSAAISVPATGGEPLPPTPPVPAPAPAAASEAASPGEAAAPPKSNKKLFIIGGAVAAVLLLSCCCLGVGGPTVYFVFLSSKVNKTNYDTLHEGMTLADIEKILGTGKPTTLDDVKTAYKANMDNPLLKMSTDKLVEEHKTQIGKDADYCWKSGDEIIIVVFDKSAKDNGKAVFLMYANNSSSASMFLTKGSIPNK